MTRDEVIETAVDLIQDGAYTDTEVSSLLDQTVLAICTAAAPPSSKRIGTFTIVAGATSTNIVTQVTGGLLPAFVKHARNVTTGKPLKVYASLELLFADYPEFNEEGDIESIAIEDFMLWSQKVATTNQDVSFIYYVLPSSTVFDWMPSGLHYPLLVCGVVARAFGEIEDGLEEGSAQGRPNCGFYADKYYKGINDLKAYHGRSKKHFLSSFWSD